MADGTPEFDASQKATMEFWDGEKWVNVSDYDSKIHGFPWPDDWTEAK
jgi:hypothetical protein